MSSKIISSHRYKKTTKKNKEKQKKIKDLDNIKSKLSIKKITKNKKTKNINLFNNKLIKVSCLCVCILIIGFLSKKIVKIENLSIINVFSNNDENIKLVKDYNFKIGISKLDTTDIFKTNNVILNEVFFSNKNRLIDINKDYTIKYLVASNVEKLSNLEYKVTINKDYNLVSKNMINSINKIKEIGSDNIYYKQISNIENVIEESDYVIKFKLKSENPYFVYTLDFPLYEESAKSKDIASFTIADISSNAISFVNNKSKSTLQSINITNYEDIDNMVENFRNNTLDMFVVSSDTTMQLIGKHEYNIKKYKDGETTFILGNKNSAMFSQKELRKALAYSLNRDEIVKKINSSSSEVIDLPYLYSNIKYKYDIYGAENILLSNGWKKNGGVYHKYINGVNKQLEMNLLVNESNKNKLETAEVIKQMVERIGIKINILKLKEVDIKARINTGDYDLVLADVYINEIPDISFIESYLNINTSVNDAINAVKSSSVEDIAKNIDNLQTVLSEEVACIGIMARDTNVVYQKYILGFDEINYMKIFDNFINIGKTVVTTN